MAAVSLISAAQKLPVPNISDMPEIPGVALRIFDTIEPGFGIVPVVGEYAGSHLIEAGEVAVYAERWKDGVNNVGFQMEPGLYCYEHQTPAHGMNSDIVARRFLSREPCRFDIRRSVVVVTRHPRVEGCWAYRELRSRLHRGVRLPARLEGPIAEWGIVDMMLGPIVGIYRPRFGGGHG